MISNDLFIGSPPVQVVWDFYMTMFRHADHSLMTRAEIARKMGKSNALITKIVKKLHPLGLVTIIYDPNVDGTSKHVLTFFLSEIIRIMADQVGFDELEVEDLDFAFSNWIEAKKLHPNYSHLEDTFTEFFHEPLWCDIAKEFPLFFYAVLVTTMFISLGDKEPETGVIQINNLFPIPSQLSYFFCVLWIHLGLQTVPYLLTRFLTPEATAILDRFLTEQTGLYKSLKTLVISEELRQDDVNKLISFFLEYINSKKFWYLDDQQLYLNSVISGQDLSNIDTHQDILVKIPLKSGDYQEFSIPSFQSLLNSPRVKEVIGNDLKADIKN